MVVLRKVVDSEVARRPAIRAVRCCACDGEEVLTSTPSIIRAPPAVQDRMGRTMSRAAHELPAMYDRDPSLGLQQEPEYTNSLHRTLTLAPS